MNLCVSGISKDSDCIIVTLCSRQCPDYELIDAAAILLLAVDTGVKTVRCVGDAIIQRKAIAQLAAALKSLGIAVAIDELQPMGKRGKYLKALLTYAKCG
ncbi:hypothetical protein SAMN02745170_00789 [Propionispora hippei DSM 15287]|uniref:Uncharacterized protein n=2 Tax=Propionispora TaxID=112902 RepID=A0A1M6CYR0_9FIRM|nr:hypothetical protein SAMN02745170_00789 [Propionispora hippei DSM 15287]